MPIRITGAARRIEIARFGLKCFGAAVGALLISALAIKAAPAQPSAAEFYKGKTVQFGVGYPPSGGFDLYTRTAARYMGKYIPGNPTVIVVNMPGASSFNYVRYIHDIATKDGTQFGMFDRGLIAKSILDPKTINVDFRDFSWIGSMNSELGVCVLWNTKNIKSFADIMKYPGDVILAGTSKNGGGYVYSAILQRMSPRNIKQVFGYTATGPMLVAAESGEVDGTCTIYSSLATQYPDMLRDKKLNVVVQYAEKRHPDLPDVATAYEIARSDNEKKVITFLTAAEAIGRPVIAPIGIPADRRDALRKAFLDTLNDPEFRAFAEKAKMDIDPVSGDAAARIIADIAATPPEAVDLARKLLE
jgi:tripartite-type tricarboxylate transporter receptor subunit TctC